MVRLRSTERRGLVPTIQEPYQPITLIAEPPRMSSRASMNNRMTTATEGRSIVEVLPVFRSLTPRLDLMYVYSRLHPTTNTTTLVKGKNCFVVWYYFVKNGLSQSSLPVTTLRRYNSRAYLGRIVSDTTSLISLMRANWKRRKEYRCPLSRSRRARCDASCATVPMHRLPRVRSISARCSFVQPQDESISQ